jgi:hypothetical protein
MPDNAAYFVFHGTRLEEVRGDDHGCAGDEYADRDSDIACDKSCRDWCEHYPITDRGDQAREAILVTGEQRIPELVVGGVHRA